MDRKLPRLMEEAQRVYYQNFPPETCFERAVFFSWGCTINDCTFCYMSTQPADKNPTETKRSTESILAEFILAKKLGWEIGFFSGGIGVFKPGEMEFLLRSIVEITGEKIWINIGPIPKTVLERFAPYLKGVVASIETINPELHQKVCPSKPIFPYEKMYETARELGLKRGMTFILGMGEVREDLSLLVNFINKHGIEKIHLYSLVPHAGTPFENTPLISKEEQAWWIAQLRIAFPILDIQCGIWEDRVERVAYLLAAGANSISKFRATHLFGTRLAHAIEEQAQLAEREFKGTLTIVPDIDWNNEVEKLSFSPELKKQISFKLNQYLAKMKKNQQEKILVAKVI